MTAQNFCCFAKNTQCRRLLYQTQTYLAGMAASRSNGVSGPATAADTVWVTELARLTICVLKHILLGVVRAGLHAKRAVL